MSVYTLPDWASDILRVHFPHFGKRLTVHQGGNGCSIIGQGLLHPERDEAAFILRHMIREGVRVQSISGGRFVVPRLTTRKQYASISTHYTVYTLNRATERLIDYATVNHRDKAYAELDEIRFRWIDQGNIV